MKLNIQTIYAGVFGFTVGDALGVPVEFRDRNYLDANPVTEMKGFGTHNQPAGTWSDDSSLAFCLLENLANGYNLDNLSSLLQRWYLDGHHTPFGKVFDIGITTSKSIQRLISGVSPLQSGATNVSENGNGSLMRIFPLSFYIYSSNLNETTKFKYIQEISGITHAHPYSVLCCYVYIDFCLFLLSGKSLQESFHLTISQKDKYISYFKKDVVKILDFLFSDSFKSANRNKIKSDGYVVHSLEASFWCLLNTNSYSEAVLCAVNLGSDTDTTACITGGPAGLVYGFEGIPKNWIDSLQKKEMIMKLCDDFYASLV
jgi:ADP-ribosylglycohydrolase